MIMTHFTRLLLHEKCLSCPIPCLSKQSYRLLNGYFTSCWCPFFRSVYRLFSVSSSSLSGHMLRYCFINCWTTCPSFLFRILPRLMVCGEGQVYLLSLTKKRTVMRAVGRCPHHCLLLAGRCPHHCLLLA